jgi:hypothetical protein
MAPASNGKIDAESLEKTMNRNLSPTNPSGPRGPISAAGIFAAGLALLLMICSFIASATAAAQTSGGTIIGTVLDPSGAPVNGAQIQVLNTTTNATQELTTSGSGLFNVPNVNPGNYLVTVNSQGFATQKVNTLVEISKETVLRIKLQIGGVDQSVTVTTSTPVVDLDDSSLSQAVDGKTVRELPLNGRDWTQLSILEPNVHTVDNQLSISAGDNSRANRGVGNQISIGGTRPQQNIYRLDGIITNDYSGGGPGGALGGTLGVDAIQEFSVVTSNATADFGRTSGGTVSAVTRAGTNQFHGSLYEFIRNSALDAKNYFSTSSFIAPFKRNQFGGSVGGPIVKNKMFFFFNYEGLRQTRTTTVTDTVPSVNARQGLLVCTVNTTTCKTGTTQINVNTLVAPYLQFFPLPNGPVSGDTGSWTFNSKAAAHENLFTGRLDYTFSQKDSIHGTALQDTSDDSQPDAYDFVVTGLQPIRKLYTLAETHTFSPNIVNFLRVGWAYSYVIAPSSSDAISPLAADTSYGFTPGATIGNLQIGGLSSFFGGVNVEGTYIYGYSSYQANDDVYITKGKHSIQTGFSFEQIQSNNHGTTTAGFYVFGSLSNFLQNSPTSFTSSVPGANTPVYMREKVFGAYIQDTYHFLPDLTFNLGMRYEPTSNITEKNGHFSVLPTPTAGAPLIGNTLFNAPTLTNFAPRVGLAWDPFSNGKTSVRASFGIYDTLPMTYMFNLSTLNVYPFSTTASLTNGQQLTINGVTTTVNLAGTFPKQTYNLAVAGNSNKYAFIDQNPKRSYVQQYNMNVQRQLSQGMSLEVGYTGSTGVRQPMKSNDGNLVEPTNPASIDSLQWPLATTTTTTTAAGASSAKTTFSGSKINPNTNIGQTDTTYWNETTSYNALNVALRRTTGSLRFGVAYTWAKAIDESSSSNGGTNFVNSLIAPYPREINRFRGLADFNVKENLTVSTLYTLPGAKGGGIKRLLGAGYQIGGIARVATGLPFTALISGDQLGLLSASVFSFPDRITTGACAGNPVNLADKFNYVNRSCFSFPQGITVSNTSTTAPNGTTTAVRTFYPTLGNERRNSIIGPGITDMDLSLVKNTAIPHLREGFRAEFRAEAFNVLNHPMFQVPSRSSLAFFNASGTATQSQLLSLTSVPERQIQFGLKLIF